MRFSEKDKDVTSQIIFEIIKVSEKFPGAKIGSMKLVSGEFANVLAYELENGDVATMLVFSDPHVGELLFGDMLEDTVGGVEQRREVN